MKNNFSMPGLLWPLLSLICLVVILYGLSKALETTGWPKLKKQKTFLTITFLILTWAGLLVVLSCNGVFSDFSKFPPRPVLAILIPLPFVLLFTFSKTGKQLLKSVPPQWLVLMQSFRIIVELLIWFAFLAGMLPIQMTMEGRNFDILTGLLALPVGYLLSRRKTYSGNLTFAFNIIGLLLLLNILVIAVLSMPGPIRYFMNEPSNTLVAEFPFILLPGLLVPIAYSFHLFSLRQLFIKNQADTTNPDLR